MNTRDWRKFIEFPGIAILSLAFGSAYAQDADLWDGIAGALGQFGVRFSF